VDKMLRDLSIGLILLIIFAPLGLLAAGTAYGEWAPDELKDRIGYVPHELEELSDLWHAPMKDYNIPNGPSFQDSKLVSSAGYILSAVIGIIVSGSLLYFIGKKAAKN
jgi:cobalt/nickel transport system permease protein/cobalt/nickel transport protein